MIDLNQPNLFIEIQTAGAKFRRVRTESSSTFEIAGVSFSNDFKGERFHWTLPQPTSLQIAFEKEGFGKKFLKIFKKELQVNDPTFDETIHIATTNQEAAAAWLDDEQIRNAIFGIVSVGGSVSISGSEVICALAGEGDGQNQEDMALIVAKVLNHSAQG